MAIGRFAGCTITGVEADTKPSHAGLVGYRFVETDTGRIFIHNGSAWVMIIGRDKTETKTNKTIDAEVNTLQNMLVSPFSLNFKRVGLMFPAATADRSLIGALGGWPTAGTLGQVSDATEGVISTFQSATSGAIIGYLSNATTQLIGRREWAVYLKARVAASSTTNSRLYIGFSSNNTLPASDTPISTSEHGVIVGFRTTDTNFSVFNNDGTGAMVAASMGTAKNTGYNTFEISMASGGNVTIKLNGTTTNTLSTDLPGNTTNIFCNCVLQLAEAVSKTLNVKGILFRADK